MNKMDITELRFCKLNFTQSIIDELISLINQCKDTLVNVYFMNCKFNSYFHTLIKSKCFSNVNSLFFTYCDISELTPQMSQYIPNVMYLSFYNNNISEIPISFCNFKDLKLLYFNNNNIRHIPIELIMMRCLTGIFLNGNPVQTLLIDDNIEYEFSIKKPMMLSWNVQFFIISKTIADKCDLFNTPGKYIECDCPIMIAKQKEWQLL